MYWVSGFTLCVHVFRKKDITKNIYVNIYKACQNVLWSRLINLREMKETFLFFCADVALCGALTFMQSKLFSSSMIKKENIHCERISHGEQWFCLTQDTRDNFLKKKEDYGFS